MRKDFLLFLSFLVDAGYIVSFRVFRIFFLKSLDKVLNRMYNIKSKKSIKDCTVV